VSITYANTTIDHHVIINETWKARPLAVAQVIFSSTLTTTAAIQADDTSLCLTTPEHIVLCPTNLIICLHLATVGAISEVLYVVIHGYPFDHPEGQARSAVPANRSRYHMQQAIKARAALFPASEAASFIRGRTAKMAAAGDVVKGFCVFRFTEKICHFN
jgi:hypothetical protein